MVVLSGVEKDFLLTMWHLRHLKTEQIWKRWYGNRRLIGCRQRLSILSRNGVLKNRKLPFLDFRSVWGLGPEAYRILNRQFGRRFSVYPKLSASFMRHLIMTNEVFLRLAETSESWGELPFEWRGSQFSHLRYVARKKDEWGIWRTRDARLVPDALISRAGSRVFLEFDRSSECIRSKDARRGIQGKALAYRDFLASSDHPLLEDGRKNKVLFVLEKIDAYGPMADRSDRRLTNILGIFKECAPNVEVEAMYMQMDEIRTAVAA